MRAILKVTLFHDYNAVRLNSVRGDENKVFAGYANYTFHVIDLSEQIKWYFV